MATTLSLMAVFVPVGFMGGIVGRVHVVVRADGGVRDRRLAARVVHADADALLAVHQGAGTTAAGAGASRLEGLAVLPSDRSRLHGDAALVDGAPLGVVVLTCVLVIASIVPLFMVIGKNFVPDDDRSEFQVTVRTPEGSGLAATLTVLERVAGDLRAFPEVTDTLGTVGGGAAAAWTPMGTGGGAPASTRDRSSSSWCAEGRARRRRRT